ncbi:MAG: hypothetical protein K0S23_3580 [Fluviicola sp.]|jgi:hypothetical protein|uniref:hypothetical protein n=1 Tax=Fluviicola sp. TaxID=1917219 RepID=UPI00260EA98E|nr:hypothetical protein [Fluviicola sp.]MDF3029273.1 hypothetical protein [Fluviicola sp.]
MRAQIIFLLLLLFAVSSCTIEKQLYSRGFHVEFHKRQPPADSHNTNTNQLITEIPETGEIIRSQDSIIDTSILKEKQEDIIPPPMDEKVIPAIKVVSRKSKIKTVSNRIRTHISIHTHFSESLMSKSLKKDSKKRSEKRDIDIDWEEVATWALFVGGLIALGFFLAPGANFGVILLGIVAVLAVIILVVFLISRAFGNYQYWFWSGR